MHRRFSHQFQPARWLILIGLAGTLFGTTTNCNDATQTAIITGAQSFATSLLNAFFDNITASQNDDSLVTVKVIN